MKVVFMLYDFFSQIYGRKAALFSELFHDGSGKFLRHVFNVTL